MEIPKPKILSTFLLSSLPAVVLAGSIAHYAITEGETQGQPICGVISIVFCFVSILSLLLIRHFRVDYQAALSNSIGTFLKLILLIPVFGFISFCIENKTGTVFLLVSFLYIVFSVFMIVRRAKLTLDIELTEKGVEDNSAQKTCCSKPVQVILITLINPIIPFLPIIMYFLSVCGIFARLIVLDIIHTHILN